MCYKKRHDFFFSTHIIAILHFELSLHDSMLMQNAAPQGMFPILFRFIWYKFRSSCTDKSHWDKWTPWHIMLLLADPLSVCNVSKLNYYYTKCMNIFAVYYKYIYCMLVHVQFLMWLFIYFSYHTRLQTIIEGCLGW